MAISTIQTQTSGAAPTTSSATVTFGSALTAGNQLFFSVGYYGNFTVTTPTGLTLVSSHLNSTAGVSTYRRTVQPGDGTGWTFTLSGADFIHAAGFELSGVDSTTPIDNTPATATAISTATSITTPTVTPTKAGTLGFACASTDGIESSFTVGSPWTLAASGVSTTSHHCHAVATQAIAGTGSTAGATITYPTASIAVGTTVLLRPAPTRPVGLQAVIRTAVQRASNF